MVRLLANRGGVVFLISVLVIVFLYYVLMKMDVQRIHTTGYVNPLVIIGAAGLIMWASQLRIRQSRLINSVALSSFAVFLLHMNPNISDSLFKPFMISLYERFDGVMCLIVEFLVLVLIFALAVLLDQPRKLLWNYLWRRLDTNI